METQIKPHFKELITPESILSHIQGLSSASDSLKHSEVLNKLIEQINPIDFEVLAFPHIEPLRERLNEIESTSDEAKAIKKELDKIKLSIKHYLVLSVENILTIANNNNWGICKNHDFIYLFNGTYWAEIEKEALQKFLGESSEKMGVSKYYARYFIFREQLFKQFNATAYLPTPEKPTDRIQINLLNGTFEIGKLGNRLKPIDSDDFLTYQLPFEYNPEAKAPLFQKFLNEVLPDIECQKVLAEYLRYVFNTRGTSSIKEEKALILYGTGANGKSVIYEVVTALFGRENASTYSYIV